MGEGGAVEEELDDEEEEDSLALGGEDAVDGVDEGCVDDDGDESLVGDFGQDVGTEEGGPVVDFGGLFADFVEVALEDELGHDLLDEGGEYGRHHEDGEDGRLKTLLGGAGEVE